jgi:hypothetical protein
MLSEYRLGGATMIERALYLGYWTEEQDEQEALAEQSAWRELWDQVLSGLVWLG